MTDIAWGPEIRVDGKRPEWLRNDEPNLAYKRESGIGYGYNCSTPFAWTEHDIINNKGGWSTVTNIRLPAGHPHYSKAPTTPDRDPALWDRMEALIRDLASADGACFVGEIKHEAQAIVAELPKPVDPDLLLARDIVMQVHIERGMMNTDRAELDAGKYDDDQPILIARAALARGRALQRGEA